MSFISSLFSSVSTISKPSLVLGVGLGVVSTVIVNRYLYQQISDLAHLDNEDNESGGESVLSQLSLLYYLVTECKAAAFILCCFISSIYRDRDI